MSLDFARASMYGFFFVKDATLSICTNHLSKDCQSLAINMGISLMNCKFSWCVEDLVMLFNAFVVCWCKHCVLYVNSVWHLKSFNNWFVGLYQFVKVCDLSKVCKLDAHWFLVVVTWGGNLIFWMAIAQRGALPWWCKGCWIPLGWPS